jgi:hypothetical protein
VSRFVRWMALPLLAALALAACGDDGGEPSGPQREQAQRADGICRETQRKVGENLGDQAAAERDAVKSAADRFLAMDPPSEEETIWQQFVQDTNNLWLNLEDIAQAQEAGDRARTQRALQRAQDTNARIAELAEKYGMTDCAKGYVDR